MEAMQNYIEEMQDKRFIQPPPFDLAAAFEDSNNVTPMVFVLTQGCDPAKDLHKLCDDQGVSDRLHAIALGQGQGKLAELGLGARGLGDPGWEGWGLGCAGLGLRLVGAATPER